MQKEKVQKSGRARTAAQNRAHLFQRRAVKQANMPERDARQAKMLEEARKKVALASAAPASTIAVLNAGPTAPNREMETLRERMIRVRDTPLLLSDLRDREPQELRGLITELHPNDPHRWINRAKKLLSYVTDS